MGGRASAWQGIWSFRDHAVADKWHHDQGEAAGMCMVATAMFVRPYLTLSLTPYPTLNLGGSRHSAIVLSGVRPIVVELLHLRPEPSKAKGASHMRQARSHKVGEHSWNPDSALHQEMHANYP